MIYAIVELSGVYYCIQFESLSGSRFSDWAEEFISQGEIIHVGDEPSEICDRLDIYLSDVEMV